MNTKKSILLLLSAATLANCQESHPAKFTIQVKDDAGTPMSSYLVHTGTLDRAASQQKGDEVWSEVAKQTGMDGQVAFEMPSETGMFGINFIQGLPDGYYLTTIPNHQFQRVENGRWVPENPLIEVVLKRKLNPIPMYAKSYLAGSSESFWTPEANKEYAYDFEIGDWVAPLGKGRSGDIVFMRTYETFPSGDYKQIIRVSFPGQKDGLIAFDQSHGRGSELVSAYAAPEDGYLPSVVLKRMSINKTITDEARRDRNYYFRVRTKLDANGKLISANYGKIYGDFMSFIYYFNPTPNDRNVEFDPKRNLFGGNADPFQVTRP